MDMPSPTPVPSIRLVLQPHEGGLDSFLATHDLALMYSRYALRRGWMFMLSDAAIPTLGQLAHTICHLSGSDVARRFQYESGIHRIQHLGVRSLQNRIHTSTVLVRIEQQTTIDQHASAPASIMDPSDRKASGLPKIRTYNYAQNRLTDHRIGRNFPGLTLLLDGDLDPLIDALDQFYRDRGRNTPEIPA